MADIIIALAKFAAEQLSQLDPKLSSAILSLVVIALLVFISRPKVLLPVSPARQPIEAPRPVESSVEALEAEVERLKQLAEDQQSELKKRDHPDYSAIEHVYFNTNGITNSVFVLVVSLLIFEYVSLADRAQSLLNGLAGTAAQKTFASLVSAKLIPTIEREVAMLLAALAVMVVMCSLIVMIGRVKTGQSIEIINRSFQLSLLVAVVAFMAIVVPLSFPGP
jgi:Holliday junction resolvasome RuvABC endonuclease subunit